MKRYHAMGYVKKTTEGREYIAVELCELPYGKLVLYDDAQAEIERLRASLAGMVESYDILTQHSPLSMNDVALGIVGGAFFGEIGKARACIAGEAKGTP